MINGSFNMCSDKFYYLSLNDNSGLLESSPNAVFCQDLINWNFQRNGVIRYDNVKHQNVGDGKPRDIYRVKDDIEFMFDAWEFDYKTKQWKPYLTDDIQVEYVMLNPYYVVQMKLLSSVKPTYYVSFKVSVLINISFLIKKVSLNSWLITLEEVIPICILAQR